MAELDYEGLQARALDNVDQVWGAANAGNKEAEARLLAIAQVQALLTVGAAMRDLAKAIRGQR